MHSDGALDGDGAPVRQLVGDVQLGALLSLGKLTVVVLGHEAELLFDIPDNLEASR